MAKVISYANKKGGVGKSTLTIQTAFYLAIKKKKKVLVVDMDGQGNTSSRIAQQGYNEEDASDAAYYGTKTAELFKDELNEIEVMKCPNGIDLIHTPKDDAELFEVESECLSKTLNPKKHLDTLLNRYDYIIIDTPPTYGRNMVAALTMATDVACPLDLSGFSVDGVEGLLSTIIGIRETQNPNLNILGLIINDMDRSVNHEKSLKALRDAIPDLIFKNVIMHRSPLDAAITEGKPIWTLPYGHVAAREVEAVMRELLDKVK